MRTLAAPSLLMSVQPHKDSLTNVIDRDGIVEATPNSDETVRPLHLDILRGPEMRRIGGLMSCQVRLSERSCSERVNRDRARAILYAG